MTLHVEKDIYGGILLTAAEPYALDEQTRAALLERWEAANEEGEVDDLLAEAEACACPAAYLIPAFVSEKDETGALVSVPFEPDDAVQAKTFRLEGPLVAEKLTAHTRVIGTVTTCGRALHEMAMAQNGDPLLREVADNICLCYMRDMSLTLRQYIKENITGDAQYATLSPGSLPSWPITAQTQLFALLGDGAVRAGVTLTPTCLMIPFKSASGLMFPTSHSFESCMRCPRLTCPHRRAAFGSEENK